MVTLFLTLSLVFAFAGNGKAVKSTLDHNVRQAFTEKAPGNFDAAAYLEKQQKTFDWLMSEAPSLSPEAIVSVHVTASDLEEMSNHQCESCGQNQKLLIGMTKPVNVNVSFGHLKAETLTNARGFQSNGMLETTADGGFVWTAAAESKNATGVRIHLTNFSLPQNAALYVYNVDGEAFGPYTGLGPNQDGDFWTNTVSGPVAHLQVRYTGVATQEDLKSVRFNIVDVAHLGPKYLLPFLKKVKPMTQGYDATESICSFNAPCVEDASCYNNSAISGAKNAIAHMQFVSGAYIYVCSGGLLADTDSSSQIPYFLTANHCISKSTEASSLECYWQFATSNCNGSCYNPVGVVPRTLGASILSTSSRTSDYCFLQLNENPPSGSYFMGWYAQPVHDIANYALYRVSHPGGAPQAYSQHKVDTQTGECRSWPRPKWIYSDDVVGATEGGSSGSPVLNANGQVVGQLSGACGYNTGDPCDSASNATVDGALAAYFSDVEQWLDPQGGTPPTGGTETHVSAIAFTTKSKGKNTDVTATVTVVDENGDPVANATVNGAFSGDVSGNVSGTTDANGQVSFKKTASGVSSATFCVTGISHASMTYNSGANVETCDSL